MCTPCLWSVTARAPAFRGSMCSRRYCIVAGQKAKKIGARLFLYEYFTTRPSFGGFVLAGNHAWPITATLVNLGLMMEEAQRSAAFEGKILHHIFFGSLWRRRRRRVATAVTRWRWRTQEGVQSAPCTASIIERASDPSSSSSSSCFW